MDNPFDGKFLKNNELFLQIIYDYSKYTKDNIFSTANAAKLVMIKIFLGDNWKFEHLKLIVNKLKFKIF